MSRARPDRVLALLVRRGDWITASELADAVSVTPRSIRSYVASLNARVPHETAVESGPQGYRAGPGAQAAQRSTERDSPQGRVHLLVRELIAATGGIDVHAAAERLFVSTATIEADLGRVRSMLAGLDLVLERSASVARIVGSERGKRRLLSRLVHDETDDGGLGLDALRRALGEGSVGAGAFGEFKTDLVAGLGELGYFVNEFGMGDVIMHIAIAADRISAGRSLDDHGASVTPDQEQIGALLDRLVSAHLGVTLGDGDRRQLSAIVLSRVVVPGAGESAAAIRARLDADVERAVREVTARAAAEFLLDIDDDDFVLRLALHVQHLRERAREQAWSRNPLTRSLKTTHPLIFEVAVYMADGLQPLLGIGLLEDEIAYIAMHVGGRLERVRRSAALLTATIVCPGYYELHELLRSSIAESLGQSIEVIGVETRADPAWANLDSDLVLTTTPPPEVSDRVVMVQPFLTTADIERVQAAAGRLRRSRRLAKLRAGLERYFSPEAFVHGLDGSGGEDAVIVRLGGMLVDAGVIDDDYVQRTIERERLSSTAFTDALAVPHALAMTATRTAIAVGIADPAIAWGEGRVQVVAMVAFSESDRAAFQTVFEQLIEVFSERESVQRIVRASTSFASFLDVLVAVIDG